MKNLILTINSGSSSLKFKLFNQKLKKVSSGIVEQIGGRSFCNFDNDKRYVKISSHEKALEKVFVFLKFKGIDLKDIKKIGHRYVHGGQKFYKPLLINKSNLKDLQKLNNLAPLHNPHNLAGIKACMKLLASAKNYVCFDTAFFHDLPDKAQTYPLPKKLSDKYNIRKYGFHGLSHQYVSLFSAKKLNKNIRQLNLITCHLGSGCSISAIKKGKPVDTSMGFTPLEGLMMATRTGDFDPAIIFYLHSKHLTFNKIEKMLNFESGLYGVSGLKDMRAILTASGYKIPGFKLKKKLSPSQKKLAKLALEMFIYRIKKYIGAYQAVLGKVDAIAFTGGIGERSDVVRKLVMRGLPVKARVIVVPANEELMIAKLII